MELSAQPVLLPSSPTSDLYIQSIEDSFSDSSHSASPRNSSGPDEVVFDSNPESRSTRQSSPHTSSEYDSHDSEADDNKCVIYDEDDNDNDDLISSLPSESRTPSLAPFAQYDITLPYTPPKTRSPFRNPSSVRDMQLDLTPPHLRSPTSTTRRSHPSRTPQYRLSKDPHSHSHSRTSTPRSTRSHFSTTRHSHSQSPQKHKPAPQPEPKKEHPLVLLHVTLLPISSPYSTSSLSALAPPEILANWALLREKVPDTVLERGILIPHPREDYELLEERLLESLELAVPRVLKCGHFHLAPEEEEEEGGGGAAAFVGVREAELSAEGEDIESAPGREGHGADEDTEGGQHDPDLCTDCGRRVRDGRYGSAGSGNKRWEIRIYAANGLMRAGAWGAAWREMERVDVEISPWMEDSVRRELENARVSEEREALVTEMEAAGAVGEGSLSMGTEGMDEGRRREIYGGQDRMVDGENEIRLEGQRRGMETRSGKEEEGRDQAFIDGLDDELQPAGTASPYSTAPPGRKSTKADVPLQHLLANYIRLLFQDTKNVALAVLAFLVLLMALRPGTQHPQAISTALAPPTPAALVSSPAEGLFGSGSSSMVPATVDKGNRDIATTVSVESALASDVVVGEGRSLVEGEGKMGEGSRDGTYEL